MTNFRSTMMAYSHDYDALARETPASLLSIFTKASSITSYIYLHPCGTVLFHAPPTLSLQPAYCRDILIIIRFDTDAFTYLNPYYPLTCAFITLASSVLYTLIRSEHRSFRLIVHSSNCYSFKFNTDIHILYCSYLSSGHFTCNRRAPLNPSYAHDPFPRIEPKKLPYSSPM